jgi:hypothetical protein
MSKFGFGLFIVGMAAADSEWLWFPVLCMGLGALFMKLGERRCSK